MEFVVRRSLQHTATQLPGLHPENHQKTTDKPTAERLLAAFSGISLTIIKTAAGGDSWPLADTPVCTAAGYPTQAGFGCFSLPAVGNSK